MSLRKAQAGTLFLSKLLTALLSVITFTLVLHLGYRFAQVAILRTNTAYSHHTDLYFSPRRVPPVAMHYDGTARYQLNGPDSAAEFAKLLPSGGHIVYIADENERPQKNTVALFHQLKCLDIIRREYNIDPPRIPSAMTQHCMNYLHQTLLCRPNLSMESTKNQRATASRSYDSVCTDWTEVYREAERNYAAYLTYNGSHVTQ